MHYSLSWAPTVAVALLDISLVSLVPHQFFQSIREGQVQLHMLLLLLLLYEALRSSSSPLHSPPLETTKHSSFHDCYFPAY